MRPPPDAKEALGVDNAGRGVVGEVFARHATARGQVLASLAVLWFCHIMLQRVCSLQFVSLVNFVAAKRQRHSRDTMQAKAY